jgi:glucose/mannose-6-phosphate isomerase
MSTEINTLKSQYDIDDMHSAICDFPNQIDLVFNIFSDWKAKNQYKDINNILVLGMGGSAIGGDVTRVLVQDSCKIPIMVNRSYNIPAWVNSNTLVIASSYSGNTEETLSAFEQCKLANSKIIAITTGGQLLELAKEESLDIVIIPAGYQPRAALGLSFTSILLLLNKLNMVNDLIVSQLKEAIPVIKTHTNSFITNSIVNSAFDIAKKIENTIPIIYGGEDLTWVSGLRFRGQIEENAKMLAFHHNMPEMNHNEIEGWNFYPNLVENTTIIWLKDQDDHPRITKRIETSKELLRDKSSSQITIWEEGRNRIERLLKLIHMTDWVSYYLALLNKVNPTPVDQIQRLKRKMAE